MRGAALGGTRAGRRLWLPREVSTPYIWLRADLGVTSSGGLVSAWASQVPGSRSGSASGAARPTLGTGGQNGRPYLTFDGSANWLAVGGISGTGLAAGNYLAWAVIDAVAITKGAAGGRTIFDAFNGTDNDRFILSHVSQSTDGKVGCYDTIGWSEPGNSVAGFQILVWDLRTGTTQAGIYRNGALVGSKFSYHAIAAGPGAGGGVSIGGLYSGAATWFQGKVYEFGLSRGGSDTDRRRLTAALGGYYAQAVTFT